MSQLCYHCGTETREPAYDEGMPYCGMCATKFGYTDKQDEPETNTQ